MEHGQDRAADKGADDLIHVEGILNHLLTLIVVQAQSLRVFIKHTRHSNNNESADAEVPEVDAGGSLAEFEIGALVRQLLLDVGGLANERLDAVSIEEPDQRNGHQQVADDEDGEGNGVGRGLQALHEPAAHQNDGVDGQDE